MPPGAEKARCAPYPVKSCPVAGAHCPPPLTCCSKTAAGELSHDCREFLPAKCSAMPAVNCSPNIPPSGWAVLAWKPSPAAYRNDPRTQKPSRPCGPGKPSAPALQQFPRRPCEARGLDAEATRRPLTLRHVPELPPVRIPTESLPCNPAPALPIHSTCCALGSRNRCGRVNFKFTFPGSLLDTANVNFPVECQAVINPFTADPVKALHFAILV